MQVNGKDLAAGVLFIAIGAAFCVTAWFTLTMGTLSRMGPGYFPFIAGILVMGFGLLILVNGIGRETEPFGSIPWRGAILVSLAPIVFGISVQGLGLAPAIALASLVACFASYKVGPAMALTVTAVLTVFCLGVFHYGLGLPIPVFGPWFGN